MFASDEKTLNEAEEKLKPLIDEFKFDQARDEIAKATAITDKGKAKKKDLINKYEWLSGFKATVTQDVGTTAYPGGLERKNGGKVTGNVYDANETSLIVKTAAGNIPVPWNDVSVESLTALALSYIKPELPADRQGDRYWIIGTFSAVEGKKPEATKFFGQAIEKKGSYKKELKAFPDVPPPG
jgi:hypothetical protein